MIDLYVIKQLLLQGLILVMSLTVHEWGHALVATHMGDSLPRLQERLSLNPLAHVDGFGTLILPLLLVFLVPGFPLLGWAKPVETASANYKNPQWGIICFSIAGPLANIAFALICVLGYKIFLYIGFGLMFEGLFRMMVTINVSLAVLNLIPLPPLDGAVVLKLLGMREETFAAFSQWSILILLFLLQLTPCVWAFQTVVQGITAGLMGLG